MRAVDFAALKQPSAPKGQGKRAVYQSSDRSRVSRGGSNSWPRSRYHARRDSPRHDRRNEYHARPKSPLHSGTKSRSSSPKSRMTKAAKTRGEPLARPVSWKISARFATSSQTLSDLVSRNIG